MKKSFLIPVLGILLAGCTNDNLNVVQPETPNQLEGKVTGYVNVQIVMPGGVNSRAYDDSYQQGPGTYLDGTPSENEVNSVRFYFFNAEKQAVKIRKNPNITEGGMDYYSFIDWEPTKDNPSQGPDHSQTVEKFYKTTLVLSQPETVEGDFDNTAKYMVAVVNPTEDILSLINNPDLSVLEAEINNYRDGLTDNNFIMSNSVYADNEQLVNVSEITVIPASDDDDDPSQMDDDAPAVTPDMDYVKIYVERIVARVDFLINLTKTDNVKDAENNIYNIEKQFAPTQVHGTDDQKSQEIYLQVLGWQLASFPSQSYLLKHINPEWDINLFNTVTDDPWTAANYHRSFWAYNPAENLMNYNFYSYDQIAGTNGATKVGNNPSGATATGFNSIYTQENANPYVLDDEGNVLAETPVAPTQVILVGQLGTYGEDGKFTPGTMCEYRGKQYTEEGLKTLIASQLQMYRNIGTEAEPNYVPVTADDLVFISQSAWLELGSTNLNPSAPEAGSDDDGDQDDVTGHSLLSRASTSDPSSVTSETLEGMVPGRYYSYLVLSPNPVTPEGGTEYTPSTTKWYHMEAPGQYPEISNVPQYIHNSLNYAKIKVWNNGYTYFFTDIRHLGADGPAYLGVVRNHIYAVNFKTIAGFGTPVLDPNEPIYPEKPENQPDDIEVTINILSWRLVSQDYSVAW